MKNVRGNTEKELRKLLDCEIVNKTKYLGITITGKNLDLFKNNYDQLWEKIDKDLLSWGKLNLSLLGKIAVVKMVILPIILFLIQTIPVVKDVKQFDRWHSKINFIWSGKKARISMKNLMDDRDRGGLQLPNFKLYQESVCLFWIKDWILLTNKKTIKP